MRAGRRGGARTALAALAASGAVVHGASASAGTVGVAGGPTLDGEPVVFGTAAVGRRLTGLSGAWTGSGGLSYGYQWSRCNAAGAGCRAISGATLPTYTLVPLDVGKTIGLAVDATDATGTAVAYASLVGPIAAARPPLVSTLQPTVSGVPVVGRSLAVTTGTWSPMVKTFTYAWERCNPNGRACAVIPGATKRSYTVTGADLGDALLALVQAENATTVQNTFSTVTPAVAAAGVHGPVELSAPQVGGSAVVGSELVASPGRWQGVGPVTFALEWYRCDLLGANCAPVRGAVSLTYPLTSADEGETVALTLRVTDLSGTTVAFASLVGPVASAGAPLTVTSPAQITGATTVGDVLTLVPASWSSAAVTTTVSWLRCAPDGRGCHPIGGATGTTYTLVPADSQHTLVAELTGSAGGVTESTLSPATAQID